MYVIIIIDFDLNDIIHVDPQNIYTLFLRSFWMIMISLALPRNTFGVLSTRLVNIAACEAYTLLNIVIITGLLMRYPLCIVFTDCMQKVCRVLSALELS